MRKAAFLLLFATACASTQQDTSMHATAAVAAPCPAASAAPLNAILWMQTSAEYQAITREIYRTARTQLDLALADPAWSALGQAATTLPPAVILDLDETAIDTSAQGARQVRSATGYSDQAWMAFSMAGNARAIQPALDFFRYAASRNVAVFYITNRGAQEKPPLLRNLTALGFPNVSEATVLTRGERPEWTGDKSSRRQFVASQYRVVELFGDDLNDFVNAAGKSIADRNTLLNANDEQLGRRWFVLPNPVYGSWERTLFGGATTGCAQYQNKVNALRTDEDYRP